MFKNERNPVSFLSVSQDISHGLRISINMAAVQAGEIITFKNFLFNISSNRHIISSKHERDEEIVPDKE